MKILKQLAAAVIAVLIASAASADTISTIEELEETALLGNLDYKTAVLDVMKAEHSLTGLLKLEDSSISLTGSYPQQSGSGLSWQASASLPVFEQLGLGAAVNQDLVSSFSLTVSPLAHSGSAAQSRLTYNTKLAAAEEKATEVIDAAVESYLDWASAASEYSIKEKTAEIKKLLYDEEKIRYEKGESDLDDVREAFTDWSDSRTALNTAFTKLQESETELYSTLNIDPDNMIFEPPASEELFRLTEALQNELNESPLSITSSFEILQAENAVSGLELDVKNTWLFEPQLNIGGGITISPEGSAPSFSATASLSFGLDDWNAEEREELKTELDIKRQEAVQVMRTETLGLEQAKTAVETAAINYQVAEVEIEQAEELLDEARFLLEMGDYSAAELDEAILMYEQSSNNLFSAAAEHYLALRALAAYAE